MEIRTGTEIYGQTKDDVFIVESLIGQGSFGHVYKIRDKSGTPFALKTLNPEMFSDLQFKALINEGSTLTSISHENVIKVYYFHNGEKYPDLPPYLIMEFASDGSLDKEIEKRKRENLYFCNDELFFMFIQLAKGMKAINDSFIHRDIKPQNILMSNGLLKIADFGIAKEIGSVTRTATFKGKNTELYCAPEAWAGIQNNKLMDEYSMGIVFYELATLTYPYQITTTGIWIDNVKQAHMTQLPQDPRNINKNLGVHIAQIIMKMMSKNPDDRYSNWEEIISKLKEDLIVKNKEDGQNKLVALAFDRIKKKREEELKQINERNKRHEFENRVYCQFDVIKKNINQEIEIINRSSEFSQIEINYITNSEFQIRLKEDKSRWLTIKIKPENNQVNLKMQKIKGYIKSWGLMKLFNGKGLNLILVSGNFNDLYGKWFILKNTHSPIVSKTQDQRPDPFPFEMDELPIEIQLINAIHIYSTNIYEFDIKIVNDLLLSEFYF